MGLGHLFDGEGRAQHSSLGATVLDPGGQPGREFLPHSGACGLQEGKGGSNQIRAGAAREASWRKGHQTSPVLDPLISPDTSS